MAFKLSKQQGYAINETNQVTTAFMKWPLNPYFFGCHESIVLGMLEVEHLSPGGFGRPIRLHMLNRNPIAQHLELLLIGLLQRIRSQNAL
ncbi:hypothetical protein SDC9_199531 [bioreactor metagenome]|uniref:Uncharacterized protein n=1 Tax=bioreactor metagenome TaxID=1076179 RepID=A0A645IKS1_9ZZZZ